MKEELKQILPDSRAAELVSIATRKQVRVNDVFIPAGEIPQKVAFVSKGLFRYVYVNDKGDEFTKALIVEHHFISSYSAMIMNRPSYFSIEALEPSEILEFQWSKFVQLMDGDLFWVKFLMKFLEKGYITKEKRERDLLLLDAETRYREFLVEFPGIDQRVKQGVIASYLGIKPETLSRIRRRIIF